MSRSGLLGHDDAGVGSRDAHAHVAVGVHGLHQMLVHFPGEHHAHEIHGVVGGDALAVDEFHGQVEVGEGAVDGLAAAVDEHRVHTQDLQKHDIGHDFGGQLGVFHGRAAVLDDDGLARHLLEPWHGLVEDLAGAYGYALSASFVSVFHER